MKKEIKKYLSDFGYLAQQTLDIDTELKKGKYIGIYHRYGSHDYIIRSTYEKAFNFLYWGNEQGEIFAIGIISKNKIEWNTDYFD